MALSVVVIYPSGSPHVPVLVAACRRMRGYRDISATAALYHIPGSTIDVRHLINRRGFGRHEADLTACANFI